MKRLESELQSVIAEAVAPATATPQPTMLTIPNILTFARLLLVPCFLFASMRGMYVAAFVIFVTAAVTDILDGMIARRLNQRSRLGALLDPAADKTLMVCGFLFYTFADELPRRAHSGLAHVHRLHPRLPDRRASRT